MTSKERYLVFLLLAFNFNLTFVHAGQEEDITSVVKQRHCTSQEKEATEDFHEVAVNDSLDTNKHNDDVEKLVEFAKNLGNQDLLKEPDICVDIMFTSEQIRRLKSATSEQVRESLIEVQKITGLYGCTNEDDVFDEIKRMFVS